MALRAVDTKVVKDAYSIHDRYNKDQIVSTGRVYVYGHNLNSYNEKKIDVVSKELVGFTQADNKFYLRHFKDASDKEYMSIARARAVLKTKTLIDSAFTVLYDRVNTNIYKNIFPEEVLDMGYISSLIDNTPTTTSDITQRDHGFKIGDVLYLDNDNMYKKALAEDSNKSTVAGVVTYVSTRHVFTLMTSGTIPYQELKYTDTSIVYLSDKRPGEMVHYSEIKNTVYVPIGVYAGNKLIINTQEGSIGDKLLPYGDITLGFETYTETELNDTINQVISGVMT